MRLELKHISNLPTFAPLKHPVFRALWTAALVSNVGTWMQDVGQSWLMTSLTSSPQMIGLLQTAASLPIFMLGIPAGALADIVDRRKLLLFTQIWMLSAAAILALAAFFGVVSPHFLLLLAFVMGIGNSLNAPAWQATVPDLVPEHDLPTAISLNSLSYNMARVVGPAIGGLIVAYLGPSAVFTLNAFSFVGVVFVVRRWEKKTKEQMLPAERVLGAIKAGLRYAKYSAELKTILLRSAAFILFSSVVWALLPVLARHELGFSAKGYGGLIGCLGLGAITAAFALPRFRKKYSGDRLMLIFLLISSAAIFGIGITHNVFLISVSFYVLGICWITINSTFIAAAQTSVASWVRARSLAIYLIVFQGGLAIGGIVWGSVALHFGTSSAHLAASGGLLVATLLTTRLKLPVVSAGDFTPVVEWPAASTLKQDYHDRGPVMISVEYSVDPKRSKEFNKLMRRVERIRRRDGAFSWGLFSDVENPKRFNEVFFVESWIEHLRQHERVTAQDRKLLKETRSFQEGDTNAIVTHWLGEQI